jgi:hypothetical protein
VVGGPLVEITAANAHVGDLEQYVFLTNFGLGNFADFDGASLRGVVYNGGRLHEEMSRLIKLKIKNIRLLMLGLLPVAYPYQALSLREAYYVLPTGTWP